MSFELSPRFSSGEVLNSGLFSEILATNEQSVLYGLRLSERDAAMLVRAGNDALQTQDRLEFGKSITTRLIEKFMLSSYIPQSEYADTIAQLLDIFYEVKEESLELLGDDEVIGLMFDFFENESGGSIELLGGRDMELLCRRIRSSALGIASEPIEEDEDEDEND